MLIKLFSSNRSEALAYKFARIIKKSNAIPGGK